MFRRSSRTSRTSKNEQTGLSRRVTKDQVHQVFGPNVSPAITVNRGETVVVETQDCYRGLLTKEPNTHGDVEKSEGIPVTGPVYIEEAHIGDVLSIQVKEIKTSDTGVFAVRSETGVPGQDIQDHDVRILEVGDNQVKLDDRVAFPLRPVIGILGVATKHGEIETVYPGRHGGNMDTLEITTGSKIFLPVQVNGALLSLGDVKACMGDGQIAGSGVEVAAEVTLRVDTQPGGRFSWPRVESKGEWITITSASTVDQAARLAITEMVKWISQDKGLDFDTAYALVSLGGGLRVSQWGNPLITARMVFPKRLINKLKSVPVASGRLNFRSLPPAANGDADGETVAAEAKPSASRSSTRSGSSRSKRSSGKSRQSGSRRGTRQQTNGTPTSTADETNTQQETAQQDETVLTPDDGSERDAPAAREKSDGRKRRTSRGSGQGSRTGRTRRAKDGASSKKDASPEQVETPPVIAEAAVESTGGAEGANEPKATKDAGSQPEARATEEAKATKDTGSEPDAKATKDAGSEPDAKATEEAKAAKTSENVSGDKAAKEAKTAKTSENVTESKAPKSSGNEPEDKAAKESKTTAARNSRRKTVSRAAKNARKKPGTEKDPTREPGNNSDAQAGESNAQSGSETQSPTVKPTFGRRQRTVRRA